MNCAYQPSTAGLQLRAIDDSRELDEKLSKLLAYIRTPDFKKLPQRQRELLERQARYMRGYAETLVQLIEEFQR